jgi:hypothetical protein
MGGIILALTVGFLLGILLMVILAAGRDESQNADHRTTGLQDHGTTGPRDYVTTDHRSTES